MDYRNVDVGEGKGFERHGSPTFYKLLEEMADTHSQKSHDYASNQNPSGNYHFAGQMATMFAHSPQDAGFVGRLAEKIYRLANLEGSGKTPKNESIADTERDIAVITALWMADRRDRRRAGKPMYYCHTCGKTTQQGAVLFVDVNQQIKCMSCAQSQEETFLNKSRQQENKNPERKT
jgi:hypothetical protein